MLTEEIYAAPRIVTDVADCIFYHTMEIPGYGLVQGRQDHRANPHEFLGDVDFRGKRVLEMGAASGFFTFYMEREGADVVSYDLSENQEWDVVPYAGVDFRAQIAERKDVIRKLNNSWWLARQAFQSKAKMVYGTVYAVPEGIGQVDIAVFGNILLHTQNPFRALQGALSMTRETVVVVEPMHPDSKIAWMWRNDRLAKIHPMKFLPDYRMKLPWDTWWRLSPHVVKQFLGVLGFADLRVTFHSPMKGRGPTQYTVVGRRSG